MPGFIDDHDHIGSIRRNVIGYEDWGLRARLAFGVTTAFDPSTLGIDQIAYQDLIDAGLMVGPRSEEHTSELQSLMRISYAVFCLKKKKNTQHMLEIKI